MATNTFLPRPEYPRPDRQRGFVHGVDWLNLNGAWEFRFDPDRSGIEQKWFAPGDRLWTEQITVPFCWQSLAAWGEADAANNDNYFSRRVYRNPLQVDRFNYRDAERYEVGWYRRTVTIPAENPWRNKRTILTIGAADFFTDCWCNGVHLGRNEGGYIPFEFDLTDALRTNEEGNLCATIVLRVEDPTDNREQPVGKQWGWYSSVSGIWQTVFIEPRATAYVERFEIRTDLEGSEALFKIFARGGTECAATVTAPDGRVFQDTVAVRDGIASGAISLPNAILWDPTDPQLYRLKLALRDGEQQCDVVHGYFGIRSIDTKPAEDVAAPAALSLNGEAIYVRGALYQSYHPDGIYTAGDVQTIKDDIAFAKRAGFDLLRIHIKIDDPLLLYYADTIGILLLADFPNFGEGGDTEIARRRFEETMRGAIARDFNHPSIIGWCLFNETWGFGGQAQFVKLINPKPPAMGDAPVGSAESKFDNQLSFVWVNQMWALAKTLDPTRLVEDMSVVAWDHLENFGHGGTDVNSWHFYCDNYEQAKKHIAEVVEKTYAGSNFNYTPGFEQGSQPLINSEYGGVGALDGDVDISWSFKFLTNELRRHGNLSAYIFTELHDVEWERNGFLNYDRTPKTFGYDSTIVNQGDVLPIDAPPIARHAPGAELEIDVYSSHFARNKREDVTLYWTLSGIDSLGWANDRLRQGRKTIAFPHYRVVLADRIRFRLPEKTMLCTLWVRAVTPDGTPVARNYVQFFVDGGFATREETSDRTILRARTDSWSGAKWSGGMSERVEAERTGACFGVGAGSFEWEFAVSQDELRQATRMGLLCEASSHREGTPQTDSFAAPTQFRMLLNGVRVYSGILPNHPHDAAGALSYLRNGRGAYGYLAHATVDGDLLRHVVAHHGENILRLTCLVPAGRKPRGGLTIYGGDCGRSPVPPTIILEDAGAGGQAA
jgi:Glycosyl hydrolases family 2, sugar binding domain/Glycosyl hydrolases family 2/Glycosyl hydrolases family 2, TIM barrel domain